MFRAGLIEKFQSLLFPVAAYLQPVLYHVRYPLIIVLGVFCGAGLFTFYASNAASYLSDDPKACINCHVMTTEYATWQHSSHALNATCSDCHVPHDSIFTKYLFKASDGLRHSFMFVFRLEPQVIRIKHAGVHAVKENCERCHSLRVSHMLSTKRMCWDCHREVPHGRVRSLSATPHAQVPRLSHILPQWLEQLLPLPQ